MDQQKSAPSSDIAESAQSNLFPGARRGARLMRLSEVRSRVGLGRSTIYRRISEGTFPQPKCLGGRAVAWLESDVDDWIAQLVTPAEQARIVADKVPRNR